MSLTDTSPLCPKKRHYLAVWALAWPLMISNISVPLLGLVDTAVIGHLDHPAYLGALAVGAMAFSILYWAFGFLRMGTTGLVAQARGREEYREISRLLLKSLVLALLLGTLLILLLPVWIALVMRGFTPPAEVVPALQAYLEIRIYSAPAALANFALMGWFIGNQNARMPLKILISANLCNVLLDLLAVWWLEMGIEGVAWASVVAEYLGVTIGLHAALRWHRQQQLPILGRDLSQWRAYLPLIQVNRYLFVRTLAILFALAFFTAQGAKQGTLILSANAVLMNFLLLISNALDGFAHAVEALAGRYFGARQRAEFTRAITASSSLAIITAVLLTLIFGLLGEQILHLLTDIPEVFDTAMRYLPWLVALPLLGVWSFMLDGVAIGVTAVRAMQNTMLLSVLGVFLPAWWLCQPLENDGLWLAFLSLFVARAFTLGYTLKRQIDQHRWEEG